MTEVGGVRFAPMAGEAGGAGLAVPSGWRVEQSDGWGPFRTRTTWRLPDGRRATWSSRHARKRSAIELDGDGRGESDVPRPTSAHRQQVLNLIASAAFVVGGSLFALGAAVAELGSADPTASSCIYFAGGLCFNTGGYVTLLQAINGPREVGLNGAAAGRSWLWWSWEPGRIDWLSALILFAGTVVFGINLLDSFLEGLTVQQENRLIWAPDMIGCALFLISGHLTLVEVGQGARWRPRRELGWWVAALNQVGSVLFLVSALAAFVRPETGSAVDVAVANWGTFAGALCFALGGVVQALERP